MDGGADTPSIGLQGGNVTAPGAADDAVTQVMRGLLHELANIATAADGVQSSLRHAGAAALPRAGEELAATVDRLFALHAELRSLLPDREGEMALDPRATGAEVARLLAWHNERRLAVTVGADPVPPILDAPWRARRQLLAAVDAAAGPAEAFRFGFRSEGDAVVAVSAAGRAFWSAPSLESARRRERGTAG
jgi:hypothetical protein